MLRASRSLLVIGLSGALFASLAAATAQMSHQHHAVKPDCAEPTLRCATKATPTFAPDGSLWLAFTAAGRVLVAHSADLAQSFTTPVVLNQEALDLDWGPDARPKIAIDRDGRVFAAFARFKNKNFDGQVLYTHSVDAGQSFTLPRPITKNPESQRFEALALDANGSLFTAWLDKRNRAAAKAAKESYVGAALAFAWASNGGEDISEARIAHDHTCECCRLAIAFAAPGRPVIAFRNVFEPNVRDHAVITFADPNTPGPVNRVSTDDWRTDACPHHGPALAVSPGGSYHVAWFTNGLARKGLFYARSLDGGRSFSNPMPIGRAERAPSHPYLLAVNEALWLTWKEFDGEKSSVWGMVSRDEGTAWSGPKHLAETADTSDQALLASNGSDVFLSWLSKAEGYRLIALGDGR
jgi:hypothetical protein